MKYTNTKAVEQIKDLCNINNISFNYDFDFSYLNKFSIYILEEGILFDFKDLISIIRPDETITFCLNHDSIYWDDSGEGIFVRINSDMGSFQTPGLYERIRIIHFLNNI